MLGLFPLRAHIGLYYDSWEPAVRQNIVVYGKGAKKEANVISYFLRTSGWHPRVLDVFSCTNSKVIFTAKTSLELFGLGRNIGFDLFSPSRLNL